LLSIINILALTCQYVIYKQLYMLILRNNISRSQPTIDNNLYLTHIYVNICFTSQDNEIGTSNVYTCTLIVVSNILCICR